MTGRYWIDRIDASARVRRKIDAADHGFVSMSEVSEAVAYFRYTGAKWKEDEVRGRRLALTGPLWEGNRFL